MRLPIVTVVEARSRPADSTRRLGGGSVYLLHLAGFKTTRAHAHGLNAALVHDLRALQIRLPAPLGLVVRVAYVKADHRFFSANIANPCHRGHLRINLYIPNALCYTLPATN